MSDKSVLVIYLLIYTITIIYFVVLGCYMLAQRGSLIGTRGELAAKLHMTRTMGVSMFIWAFDLFVYLPPLLWGCTPDHPVFKVLFHVNLALSTPVIFAAMFAVVQRQVNLLRWSCALSAPFLLLTVWQLLAPSPASADLPLYIAAALSVASNLFLLIRFASEYRLYIRRLQAEYSETASRDIVWSWVCFAGLAMQGLAFVAYQLLWSPMTEVIYAVLSVINAACLCYCTCRQHTIDLDLEPEAEPVAALKDKPEGDAFYADIEQKLKTLCEDQLLFLNPELRRETLALRLAINRTYLSMYFRHCGTSYYQYINTLRIEYAVRLMQDNPDLPVDEVCTRSGYRSLTTFRKAFQEVMGCLPSEVKRFTFEHHDERSRNT